MIITMEKLTSPRLKNIKSIVIPIYDHIVNRYDSSKYPESVYNEAVQAFSQKNIKNNQIENALKWKWGHWGKSNFPEDHKKLISLVEDIWPDYTRGRHYTGKETFDYWRDALVKRHRYITVAFITHLLHPEEVPIIDQHNFRAMNHLITLSGIEHDYKKKPSTFDDIKNLKSFLYSLSDVLDKEIREVDRFLMMYGRYNVPR